MIHPMKYKNSLNYNQAAYGRDKKTIILMNILIHLYPQAFKKKKKSPRKILRASTRSGHERENWDQ